MDIEKELQSLLDRYKIEKDIQNAYLKNKGLFDGDFIWVALLMLMGMGGFGGMPTSINNIYPEKSEGKNEH